MDLQARLNLRDDQKRKVVLKNASGTVVGMMTLQEPLSDTGPLDALQRSINDDMRGGSEMARALFAEHGKLVVTDATAEEIRAFRLLRRVN